MGQEILAEKNTRIHAHKHAQKSTEKKLNWNGAWDREIKDAQINEQMSKSGLSVENEAKLIFQSHVGKHRAIPWRGWLLELTSFKLIYGEAFGLIIDPRPCPPESFSDLAIPYPPWAFTGIPSSEWVGQRRARGVIEGWGLLVGWLLKAGLSALKIHKLPWANCIWRLHLIVLKPSCISLQAPSLYLQFNVPRCRFELWM